MEYAIKARKGFFPIFNGAIGQVLQNDSGKEYYRRSPGVRAIIPTDTGLILQKEKRPYLDREWDYRLPGGKVADTLNEYLQFLRQHFTFPDIREALKNEVRQEVGLIAVDFKEYHVSESSATIEHDLYYFLITNYKKTEQDLQHDEEIEVLELSYKEVWDSLLDKKFSEDRTRAVLFEYLIKEKSSFLI